MEDINEVCAGTKAMWSDPDQCLAEVQQIEYDGGSSYKDQAPTEFKITQESRVIFLSLSDKVITIFPL